MQISICAILSFEQVLVLAIAGCVFVYAIILGEQSIHESADHGEEAVLTCFDEYLGSIKTTGESFVKTISLQLSDHVSGVVDYAEAKARSAATAVERTGFMDTLATNDCHGSQMLPSFGWMVLGPLEEHKSNEDAVVADIVIASFNSTEETNNWAWFGLSSSNPNKNMGCDFYYYRNATNASSSLWCIEDLYKIPDQPSPSIWPHPYSAAIVKLQDATPCDVAEIETERPLVWMPLDFFVWTSNKFALTSVVGGVHGPDGTCEGFAAANVRFTSMAKYLTSLVGSARYANLSIALIETRSGQILGTSLGSAIYKENHTIPDGGTIEQERPATLAQMNHPLATALNVYIEENYGSLERIQTPLITSATLEGQEYFLSFENFARPMLNITICAFLPHSSITGPIETQRHNNLISYDQSAAETADHVNDRLTIAIAIGVGGLLACAIVATITACYLSSQVRALVNFMDNLRSMISNLDQQNESFRASSTTISLCKPLPPDYFPVFGATKLQELNQISAATEDLCSQLLSTWNANIEVFRRALEQRQFTASIAHDIRNPLHGVLGIVSMMQSDIDANNNEKLSLLSDTLNHMAALLNDMVDLSKIQGGKVVHAMKTFDAFNTLHEVFVLYQSIVASKGGTLSCIDRSTSSLPKAYSDPVHVQRILTNFVSNASKYAAGCEIMLKAMVASREEVERHTFLRRVEDHFDEDTPYWSKNAAVLEHEQYIVLACLDKGRGIPSSKLGHVFDAYQQAQVADRHHGAGLGLAITKGLAVEMGGGIGVQSLEGSGSLFWLVVPCSPNKEVESERAPDKSHSIHSMENISSESSNRSTPPTTVSTSALAGCHVLVVDDTNLNLMLLKHFLKRLEMKPETSSSAEGALSKLRQNPEKFSLIISDFNMPEMSGGDMCLEIRQEPGLCHLPFICSSGNQLNREERDTYKIDGTLMKPFTIDQLQQIIQHFIHRPSRWAPAPVQTLSYDNKSNTSNSIEDEELGESI